MVTPLTPLPASEVMRDCGKEDVPQDLMEELALVLEELSMVHPADLKNHPERVVPLLTRATALLAAAGSTHAQSVWRQALRLGGVFLPPCALSQPTNKAMKETHWSAQLKSPTCRHDREVCVPADGQ